MEFIALIPSYQPDDNLIRVVLEFMQSFHIVVVDDGSGDDYKDIFSMIPKVCTLITHEVNKGKGMAIKTGLKYIQEQYKDKEYVIVTLDDDGKYSYEDSLKVAQKAEKNPDVLVLGSRNLKEANMKKSAFGNFLARTLMKISTGNNIYDTQTGLRAFTNKNIENLLEIEGKRYEYETSMILYLSREKIPIIEVPIKTVYLDGASKSHYNPLKDSLRIFKQFLKFAMSSIIGFFVDFILFSILVFAFPEDLAMKVLIANVIARVASSIVNFIINRFFVFKLKKGKVLKYAIKYFGIATVSMILNTALLVLFVDWLGWNEYATKLIVEFVLFLVSYTFQKIIIAKSKQQKN
ncbi:MAG: bifunctional glycosyltransferase family 2/GtrA family protein [Bacilli bacterium]|nr:bifunctional glycosyltransferase family 2/GtrA family protein [Bacilli bacterium]